MSMPDYQAGKGKPLERRDAFEHTKRHSLKNLFMSHLKTQVDLWPIFALMATAFGAIGVMAWWSFRKLEVQVVRGTEHHPLDWERARDVAYTHKWKFSDWWTGGKIGERIPELDKLQDEMVEAKKSKPKPEKGGHH